MPNSFAIMKVLGKSVFMMAMAAMSYVIGSAVQFAVANAEEYVYVIHKIDIAAHLAVTVPISMWIVSEFEIVLFSTVFGVVVAIILNPCKFALASLVGFVVYHAALFVGVCRLFGEILYVLMLVKP